MQIEAREAIVSKRPREGPEDRQEGRQQVLPDLEERARDNSRQ